MKTKRLPISLMILVGFLFVYPRAKPLAAAIFVGLTPNDVARVGQTDLSILSRSEQIGPASDQSCADPVGDRVAICRILEQAFLDSTVRLLIYALPPDVEGSNSPIFGTISHGTVMEGRYLVTHNHYEEAVFPLLGQDDPENLFMIDIFDAGGELILQVPSQRISVLVADRQTMVLDFGESDGLGLFAALGLPSAEFMAQPSMPLQPGMEVAQIDWDGTSSHINWVTIEEVITESIIPNIKLSDCIGSGASGGGVFWQGHHIGNNLSRSFKCNPDLDSATAYHSKVVLNSQPVTTPRSSAADLSSS
jgi:hypothetical protein